MADRKLSRRTQRRLRLNIAKRLASRSHERLNPASKRVRSEWDTEGATGTHTVEAQGSNSDLSQDTDPASLDLEVQAQESSSPDLSQDTDPASLDLEVQVQGSSSPVRLSQDTDPASLDLEVQAQESSLPDLSQDTDPASLDLEVQAQESSSPLS